MKSRWGGKRLVGGLFAVKNGKDKQRLIFDRRPQNSLEQRRVWVRLPAGAQLPHIYVPKVFALRGSGKTLSNYFSI